MKKVLILDRYYTTRLAKSDKYEFIMASLTSENRKKYEAEGYNVVGCFEDEYVCLETANYPDNYLLFSFDSDRFLKRFSIEKRREILGKEITFWSKILDEYKPDFVINEVCTIEWMEVLYIEAKKRNIEYKTFLYGQVPHKCYWLDSPFNSTISKQRFDSVVLTQDLIKQASNYCQEKIEKQQKPFYAQVKTYSNLRCLISSYKRYFLELWKEKKHKGFMYEYYSWMRRLDIETSTARIFKSYDCLPTDNNCELLFYPLHYEPESTLSYFSEYYSDQASVIKQLSHCLNTNQKLIVKEHPQQSGMLLSSRFQELKKTCNNLIFLPGNVSSFDVLNRIKVLITLTGTGGFEAMIFGIPVIVLGEVFYNKCKSVNYCNSMKEVKQLLRDNSYRYPNKEYTIDFVARFFALQTDFFPYYVNGSYEQSDIDNMKKYIESL